MTEEAKKEEQVPKAEAPAMPVLHVAPAPHLFSGALTTRRMMFDVLLALVPVLLASLFVFC